MLEFDLAGRGITDPELLKAMCQIRREEFVPEQYKSQAYADGPLSIGLGQTISQPYIVALMTQQLQLNKDCDVLEIGTGSGYQTAVLSRLAKKVYTIEKITSLSLSAREVLAKLGADNIEFYIGDGSCGWPEKRSFDRIIITAAVPGFPEPVFEQLRPNGKMIAPVGYASVQELVICEKKSGKMTKTKICDVRFVKLLGKFAFEQ